jgi:hypothetical protein
MENDGMGDDREDVARTDTRDGVIPSSTSSVAAVDRHGTTLATHSPIGCQAGLPCGRLRRRQQKQEA